MASRRIEKCVLPDQSLLRKELIHADFLDAYRVPLRDKTLSPLQLYLAMVEKTPTWINFLLSIRNVTVKLFGLKDVGNLGDIDKSSIEEPFVGAKLDIFYIEYMDDTELVLSLNDTHLNIKLSLLKYSKMEVNYLTLSSWVKFNNFLGRLYMGVITPFHKIIVKRMLNSLFDTTTVKTKSINNL